MNKLPFGLCHTRPLRPRPEVWLCATTTKYLDGGFKLNSLPNPDGLLQTVKKYFLKGYTFYMPYKEMWQMLDVPEEKARELVNNRKIEITGFDIDGKKVGEGWKSSSVPELQKQLHTMVEAILDEWMKLGKLPV